MLLEIAWIDMGLRQLDESTLMYLCNCIDPLEQTFCCRCNFLRNESVADALPTPVECISLKEWSLPHEKHVSGQKS